MKTSAGAPPANQEEIAAHLASLGVQVESPARRDAPLLVVDARVIESSTAGSDIEVRGRLSERAALTGPLLLVTRPNTLPQPGAVSGEAPGLLAVVSDPSSEGAMNALNGEGWRRTSLRITLRPAGRSPVELRVFKREVLAPARIRVGEGPGNLRSRSEWLRRRRGRAAG
jgi:hypothetical protein